MADKAFPGQKLLQTALGKAGFINDLVDVVHWFKTQRGGGRGTKPAFLVIVGKADDDIPAASDDTPGTGTVSVWHKKNGIWQDAGYDVEVENFSEAAVTADKFLVLLRHEQSGAKIPIFESCPA